MIDRLILFQADTEIESCCCNRWFLGYRNIPSLHLCWGRELSVPLLIKYRHLFQNSWKFGHKIDSRLYLCRQSFPYFISSNNYTFLSIGTIIYFFKFLRRLPVLCAYVQARVKCKTCKLRGNRGCKGLLSSQPFNGSVPISFNCVKSAAILTHHLLEHFLAFIIMDKFLLLQKDEV